MLLLLMLLLGVVALAAAVAFSFAVAVMSTCMAITNVVCYCFWHCEHANYYGI